MKWKKRNTAFHRTKTEDAKESKSGQQVYSSEVKNLRTAFSVSKMAKKECEIQRGASKHDRDENWFTCWGQGAERKQSHANEIRSRTLYSGSANVTCDTTSHGVFSA